MAVQTKAKTKSMEEFYQELVPIELRKDNWHREDVTVTVNGVNYQIQRGVSVKVPRSVALVLERSRAQEAAAQAYVDRLKG